MQKRLHKYGRVDDAVRLVAWQLLEQSRVLCLDEVEGKPSCLHRRALRFQRGDGSIQVLGWMDGGAREACILEDGLG